MSRFFNIFYVSGLIWGSIVFFFLIFLVANLLVSIQRSRLAYWLRSVGLEVWPASCKAHSAGSGCGPWAKSLSSSNEACPATQWNWLQRLPHKMTGRINSDQRVLWMRTILVVHYGLCAICGYWAEESSEKAFTCSPDIGPDSPEGSLGTVSPTVLYGLSHTASRTSDVTV